MTALEAARFFAALTTVPDDVGGPERLCQACLRVLAFERAAIAVDVESTGRELLCASDSVAERIEGLQATVGEGPGIEAAITGMPVILDDFATIHRRWPLLGAALDLSDCGAMYALPLQVGAVRVGVLDLYRVRPGRLERADWVAATSVARMVTMILLGDGRADGNGSNVVLGSWWDSAPRAQEIHQASGMIAVQLTVSVRQAYARLQAHAFAGDRTLGDVAHDVVTRQLRFDPAAEQAG
ncbi:GAF and ANTAR domain-containing protein [Nocardia sp. NPDC051052]|uniref:GAF and ANTAR domain-containing protein n=1 Tax=Nocardia sp. NPDC051052 TaxID=3364322 RepID=UPI0037BBB2D4